jgi:hypothetical protein
MAVLALESDRREERRERGRKQREEAVEEGETSLLSRTDLSTIERRTKL